MSTPPDVGATRYMHTYNTEFVFIFTIYGSRYNMNLYVSVMARDISVGIATGYALDGPGIESQSGRDFSHTSRPALGHTQAPVQWVPGLSRDKVAGA
jgi:hypothetical protein